METENLNTKIAHNTPIPTEVAALEYWKFAIEKNRTQLIDAGAQIGLNLNARNEWGWCAVAHAVLFNRTACLRSLLEHGASANVVSEIFGSLLSMAQLLKHKSIETIILKHLTAQKQLSDVRNRESETAGSFPIIGTQQLLNLIISRLEKERL